MPSKLSFLCLLKPTIQKAADRTSLSVIHFLHYFLEVRVPEKFDGLESFLGVSQHFPKVRVLNLVVNNISELSILRGVSNVWKMGCRQLSLNAVLTYCCSFDGISSVTVQ